MLGGLSDGRRGEEIALGIDWYINFGPARGKKSTQENVGPFKRYSILVLDAYDAYV